MKEHLSGRKEIRSEIGSVSPRPTNSLAYLSWFSSLLAWRGMWGLFFFFVCFLPLGFDRLTRAVYTVRNHSKHVHYRVHSLPRSGVPAVDPLLLIYLVVPLTDSMAAHHPTHNTYVFRTTVPSSPLSPPFPTKTPTPSFHFKGRKKK